MTFDASVPLDAITAILEGLPGMGAEAVLRGAVTDRPRRLTATVSLGALGPVGDKNTGGNLEREVHIIVTFGYRVGAADNGSTAETTLASVVDAFTRAFYEARKADTLGLSRVTLDFSLADAPDYQAFSAREVRVYPVVVIGTQAETI